MRLTAICTICHATTEVNGQRQFDAFKAQHKHEQTELDWRLGNAYRIEYPKP